MDYKKRKDFFLGVDSDGTAFDSMTIKHTFSCVPAAIEVFDLKGIEEEFKNAEEKANLYSVTRGVNRFPGLLLSFEELEEKGVIKLEGLNDLRSYVNSGYPLSNPGLRDYISSHPCEFLNKVLEWSFKSDILFAEKTQNIPPFEEAYKAIINISKKADVMVVSAASGEGLKKDWGNAGLSDAVCFIAGQEFGNKAKQLEFALSKGYDISKMLMTGDASGDYDAAKKVGARFYPIIPTMENECWRELNERYFDMFINGDYTEEKEKELYDKFISFLKGENND